MQQSYSLNSGINKLKYFFTRNYSALYHYNKHNTFGKEDLLFEEYITKANNIVYLAFKIFYYDIDPDVFKKSSEGNRSIMCINIRYIANKMLNSDLKAIFTVSFQDSRKKKH
ncbi:hypothetical protein DMUE_0787 [Dictyocoela muelleri]|nr:hypothetical protein DMUE_0787 [Dictyocoela muelleri]